MQSDFAPPTLAVISTSQPTETQMTDQEQAAYEDSFAWITDDPLERARLARQFPKHLVEQYAIEAAAAAAERARPRQLTAEELLLPAWVWE